MQNCVECKIVRIFAIRSYEREVNEKSGASVETKRETEERHSRYRAIILK